MLFIPTGPMATESGIMFVFWPIPALISVHQYRDTESCSIQDTSYYLEVYFLKLHKKIKFAQWEISPGNQVLRKYTNVGICYIMNDQ